MDVEGFYVRYLFPYRYPCRMAGVFFCAKKDSSLLWGGLYGKKVFSAMKQVFIPLYNKKFQKKLKSRLK